MPVDVDAVRASDVVDREAIGIDANLGMVTRASWIIENDVAGIVAPEAQGTRRELERLLATIDMPNRKA